MRPRFLIAKHIEDWRARGYPDDIPDEVPDVLSDFAPSYKAICQAILKNDLGFHSLGMTPKVSAWYSAIKRVEIEERNVLRISNS